jgi:NADPH:quinone reductase-like Zn-dependent oxidoreductase
VKSLGADDVVDYTREDFSSAGRVYDVVFDTVGKSGFSRSLRSLKRGGFYVRVGGSARVPAILRDVLRGIWISTFGQVKVITGVTRGVPEDLVLLKELIEEGKLRTVIDRLYSLDQIAEAHRHAEAGHKKGHVVIVIHETSAKST